MIKKPLIAGISGLALVALGIAAMYGIPAIVEQQVEKRITLTPESQMFPFWKDIPVPTFQKFYFFNITNAAEIERIGAKPILKEVGPFTYQVYLNKTDITFNPNGTVSFREKKTWVFRKDRSFADESFVLTTLNGPLAMTLTLIQSASSAVRVIVGLALDAITEGFFINRSVKQLLFEGYPDILISFASVLNPEITSYSGGRFAWFVGKNATDDGMYSIYTGEKGKGGLKLYNTIERFRNKSALPYWLNEDCNSLEGSTIGEMFPPLDHETKHIKLFNPDLCRVLTLDFKNTHQAVDGLTAQRYELNKDTFKNAVEYPPNACYDSKLKPPRRGGRLAQLGRQNSRPLLDEKVIFPSGVFDISKCKFGVPIVVSHPHFLHADPYFLTTLDGLRPNESLHNFYFDVHPTTGSTINLAARVQINVAINKAPGFRYRNIPNMVFPVLWQEYETEMSEQIGDQLWLASHLPSLLGSVSAYSCFTIGGLLILAPLMLLSYKFLMKAALHLPKVGAKKQDSQDDNSNILGRQTSGSSSIDLGIDNPIPVQP